MQITSLKSKSSFNFIRNIKVCFIVCIWLFAFGSTVFWQEAECPLSSDLMHSLAHVSLLFWIIQTLTYFFVIVRVCVYWSLRHLSILCPRVRWWDPLFNDIASWLVMSLRHPSPDMPFTFTSVTSVLVVVFTTLWWLYAFFGCGFFHKWIFKCFFPNRVSNLFLFKKKVEMIGCSYSW